MNQAYCTTRTRSLISVAPTPMAICFGCSISCTVSVDRCALSLGMSSKTYVWLRTSRNSTKTYWSSVTKLSSDCSVTGSKEIYTRALIMLVTFSQSCPETIGRNSSTSQLGWSSAKGRITGQDQPCIRTLQEFRFSGTFCFDTTPCGNWFGKPRIYSRKNQISSWHQSTIIRNGHSAELTRKTSWCWTTGRGLVSWKEWTINYSCQKWVRVWIEY